MQFEKGICDIENMLDVQQASYGKGQIGEGSLHQWYRPQLRDCRNYVRKQHLFLFFILFWPKMEQS